MRRILNVIDRLVVGVVGLILLGGGVVALLWWQEVPVVVDEIDQINDYEIYTAPDESWWPWAMLVATVVLAVAGLWLVLANLRPNRFRSVVVGSATGVVGGQRAVSVPDVGKAAAKSLERHPQITSTQTRSFVEGTTPTLELTVTADPAAEGRELVELLRAVRHQLQRSLAGADVSVQVLLHRAPNQ